MFYGYFIKKYQVYFNGIPTGLPSSNIVFTLALEEIIHRWMNTNNYQNNREFILNVYIDDIYLKIIDKNNANTIVKTLVQQLENHNFEINKNKSKAESSLEIQELLKLKESDYYLGIPFTQNMELYFKLILNELRVNKFNGDKITWFDIHQKISNDGELLGFISYKLRPWLDLSNQDNRKYLILKFIRENLFEKIFGFDKLLFQFVFLEILILILSIIIVLYIN
jgi:hypothetical protein